MKAIIKRNLKNYLKNPIFWIGLIVVLISMYQTLAPYLSIHYVKSDETFRKVKMASDGDVMEGCIPATPDKERELWEKEIVKILQDTENGFGMSEVEAEAVISEMKQMKITEACQYLKTEYHFNGANYVYEDVSWYQGSPEEVNRYIRERTVLFSTHVVEDLMATCNQLAVMKKGRFLYTGTMRELLNKARGHVWECCTEDESLARELERKYHISSKQYTEEGIRLRLLGENMPSESGCIACDVTLEDAYIYVTNR